MGRATVTITDEGQRKLASHYVARGPVGTRITFQGPKRTVSQSDKMWAMLTDISRQTLLYGVAYSPEDWKTILLADLGKEMRLCPSLDGPGFVQLGHSSSALAKDEMSDFIELIYARGAERGVVFSDPKEQYGAP